MTTAHRPTWAPAKGHEEQGGMRIFAPSQQFSAKDMASHTKMKYRQVGQNSKEELLEKDLAANLLERERKHFRKKGAEVFEEEREKDLQLLQGPERDEGGRSGKALVPKAIDADDDEDDAASDSDDDSDEDEEAELLAELEKIKQERAKEAEEKARKEAASKEAEMREEALRGNPLVNQGGVGFQVKRRWDDDVVFRNQARGEPKIQKRFVNDTIRNDFHRRFLTRYIK